MAVTSTCTSIPDQDLVITWNAGSGMWRGAFIECTGDPSIEIAFWCEFQDPDWVWCCALDCDPTKTICLTDEDMTCEPSFMWHDLFDAMEGVEDCCDCTPAKNIEITITRP